MTRASKKGAGTTEAPVEVPVESPEEVASSWTVCAVSCYGPADGPSMAVQHAILKGFALMFDGTYTEGRHIRMLRIRCPMGDVDSARRDVLGKVDLFTATGMNRAEQAARQLAARQEEIQSPAVGMAALRWALDRIGSRYDVFEEVE